ncbi:hypothetical protein [Halopelagius longus]|uniref:Uncharacterized protein n=1 Tax=Halopelagius longus TaxID=1236180 RepID=A0A1H0YCK1_9EURY|nr:hypothetical protein [Halopelagius longus]SDQ12847.1 hypothetical protein SAMN05216278_0551 [Halopelagius longus]
MDTASILYAVLIAFTVIVCLPYAFIIAGEFLTGVVAVFLAVLVFEIHQLRRVVAATEA